MNTNFMYNNKHKPFGYDCYTTIIHCMTQLSAHQGLIKYKHPYETPYS